MAEHILMTVDQLCKATGGEILCDFSDLNGFSSVATDSRKVLPGSLFIPLMGEFQDGHAYIQKALDCGASVILVDSSHAATARESFESLSRAHRAAVVVVSNTLTGLQDAARAYVSFFPGLLKIGVTGSSGKTTTKEIIGSIFSRKYRVVMNEGNLNSETGLPLSVFRIRADHEVGIFELGMNRRGEISEIARVLSPSLALITNIGTAHIGILGTQTAIAEEKKAIFSFFDDSSTGFVPEHDRYADFLRDIPNGTVLTYGAESTPGFEGADDLGIEGSRIRYEGRDMRFPLPGSYNLGNALGAIALARFAGLNPDEIKAGIESVRPLFGRAEVIPGDITVMLDCYNANPDSMESAIDFCSSLDWKGRKLFVLGSMLELGAESEEAHLRICRLAARGDVDAVFLFGDEMIRAGHLADWGSVHVEFCGNIGELTENLSSTVRTGDLVFVKGSRGMALERVVPVLTGGAKPEGGAHV